MDRILIPIKDTSKQFKTFLDKHHIISGTVVFIKLVIAAALVSTSATAFATSVSALLF